jgi:hypothetical protein
MFDEFTRDVLDGVKALAVGALKDQATALRSDALAFIKSSEAKLEMWGEQLQQGEIDEQDMATLVRSQKGLAKMATLTAAGIAATKVKRLRDQLISIVSNAALRAFLP